MKYTDEQLQQAYIEHGSYAKVAKALDIHQRSVERRFANMKRRGWAPEYELTRIVPDGLKMKGLSDMRTNPEGKPVWYKFDEDKERQAELMQQVIDGFKDELPSVEPVPIEITLANENLLNCYVVTDYHLGMLAWGEESGEDWDMKIAESILMRYFQHAIENSPGATTGILANIGDFLHWDGLEAVTPTSKHVLDADTRFQKVVRVAIRCIRNIVDMMLKKHPHVHIIMADANHDPASGAWLREFLDAHYDNEPRITVDNSPSTYYVYQHGDTSLFFHHGHRRKPNNIDDVFVAKFRDIYGRTKYSYAHMGHLHHVQALETNLMIIEQHRTLAAHDAYAAQHGYLSGRDAKVITYHRDYGEVSRLSISPEMLK